MRKLIACYHISLDGVVQGPGGPDEDTRNGFDLGGFSAPFEDDLIGETIMGTLMEDYDLLLGRFTYDIWAAYWPDVSGNPIADKFNAITKYVASHTLQNPVWQNTVVLEGDAAEAVARLKATEGPDLHIWGSGDFMQTLMAAGLVDEFRFWMYPIVLGKGLKLFPEGAPSQTLKLVSAKVSPCGTIISTYQPAGPVKTGQHG